MVASLVVLTAGLWELLLMMLMVLLLLLLLLELLLLWPLQQTAPAPYEVYSSWLFWVVFGLGALL